MIRLGLDFGGTKIEAAAVDASGAVRSRLRTPTPATYEEAVEASASLLERVLQRTPDAAPGVGVALPGSISPRTGRVRNANSVFLNGRSFDEDLARRLGRPVRVANDANCFALSEARDGAGAGAVVVFGLILGTGCGGGLVVGGGVLPGAGGVAGEIGHAPLPWADAGDPPRPCWCGRSSCIETYVSGSAFVADYADATGDRIAGAEIMRRARAGEAAAAAVYERYRDRLARVLALIVDVLDPDVLVLGGGMSNIDELYRDLPGPVEAHAFTDALATRILPARHGDSSGVRGAAWLWSDEA